MSESKGVIDACVFDCEDYLLSTSQGNDEDELEWVGVKNVLDKKSSDMWAKSVGWHETCIGELLLFLSFLSLISRNNCLSSLSYTFRWKELSLFQVGRCSQSL
jgi:hypothetical protein